MKRTFVALAAPPAAVIRHGCATCTAAPIGVFWLTSLASIGYGLAGGTIGSLIGPNGLVTIGVLLWLIATAWARLVMRAVESDHLQKRVTPQTDESDPFSQLRSDL